MFNLYPPTRITAAPTTSTEAHEAHDGLGEASKWPAIGNRWFLKCDGFAHVACYDLMVDHMLMIAYNVGDDGCW